MIPTHIAYPIKPHPAFSCRCCKTAPACYRAVQRDKNRHTQAARYRCEAWVRAMPEIYEVAP